jgi:hypothetical protein
MELDAERAGALTPGMAFDYFIPIKKYASAKSHPCYRRVWISPLASLGMLHAQTRMSYALPVSSLVTRRILSTLLFDYFEH